MNHHATHGGACACHCCKPEPEPETVPGTPARCAMFGARAVDVGTPDRGQNGADADGATTDAGDTIANVLHWLESQGGDVDRALERARRDYFAESAERDA